jgi:Na+-driven multidrug efflux pump
VIGFQIVSANYFIVVGKPKTAIFLSMSRQLIVLIPSILILGHFFGLYGVIWAMPVADFTATAMTALMIIRELKDLKRKIQEQLAEPAENHADIVDL